MAKKTVIRRLFKYLPVSIDTVRAIEVDEKSERGEAVTQADFIDATYVDKGQVVEPIDVGEEPETTPIEVIEPGTKNAGAQ